MTDPRPLKASAVSFVRAVVAVFRPTPLCAHGWPEGRPECGYCETHRYQAFAQGEAPATYADLQAGYEHMRGLCREAQDGFTSERKKLWRVEAALRECSDKLWIARCDSKDEAFRQAAERACNMATAALVPPRPMVKAGDHGR